VLSELTALGIELSPVELGSLESLDAAAMHRFAQTLDPRLQKAVLMAEVPSAPGGEEP